MWKVVEASCSSLRDTRQLQVLDEGKEFIPNGSMAPVNTLPVAWSWAREKWALLGVHGNLAQMIENMMIRGGQPDPEVAGWIKLKTLVLDFLKECIGAYSNVKTLKRISKVRSGCTQRGKKITIPLFLYIQNFMWWVFKYKSSRDLNPFSLSRRMIFGVSSALRSTWNGCQNLLRLIRRCRSFSCWKFRSVIVDVHAWLNSTLAPFLVSAALGQIYVSINNELIIRSWIENLISGRDAKGRDRWVYAASSTPFSHQILLPQTESLELESKCQSKAEWCGMGWTRRIWAAVQFLLRVVRSVPSANSCIERRTL